MSNLDYSNFRPFFDQTPPIQHIDSLLTYRDAVFPEKKGGVEACAVFKLSNNRGLLMVQVSGCCSWPDCTCDCCYTEQTVMLNPKKDIKQKLNEALNHNSFVYEVCEEVNRLYLNDF
jgi:hypothetical protein